MPLTVYADVLVIINLYVDFFLLWSVKKFLRLGKRNRQLVLGALTGGAFSLTALLPQPPPFLSLLLGLGSALAVTAAAFCPLAPRLFWKAAFCFWGFSLLLAGFFLFLIRFFAPQRAAVLGTAVYFDLSPALLFFFTCAAYLVFALAGRLESSRSPETRYKTLLLENRGASVKLWAKADTGNNLREPFSGLPVIVCQADCLKEAAPREALEFLETGAPAEGSSLEKGLRLVPFETLNGTGVLPAFQPEQVKDEKSGVLLNCWVALCPRKLSAGQFDALYNPDLFDR